MKPKRPTPELYLAFPKAAAVLRERIGATENEIACWLFFDQIKAFGHVSDFCEPPEISLTVIALSNWTTAAKDSPPHLNALQGAYFLKYDIENFDPPVRYISFGDLIQRWSAQCQTEDAAAALISSKIGQDRLHDFAPGLGPTILSQTHFTTNIPHPPAEWAMFDCAEVEAVEEMDFPSPKFIDRDDIDPSVQRNAAKQTAKLKRSALIDEFSNLMPSIDRDLADASRKAPGGKDSLSDLAKLGGGFWNVEAVITWGKERGKIQKKAAERSINTNPDSIYAATLRQLFSL